MRVVDVAAQNSVNMMAGDRLRQGLRVAQAMFVQRLDRAENRRVMDGDQIAKWSRLSQLFCKPCQLERIQIAMHSFRRFAVQHDNAQPAEHGTMVVALRFVRTLLSQHNLAELDSPIMIPQTKNERRAEFS